jgi:hypothetical protein
MRIVYRAADAEHVHESDGAGGRILAAIARTLPREVAAIAHSGIEEDPVKTTRDELLAAIRAVLGRIEAEPALLFAYGISVEAQGDEPPARPSFAHGSGLTGIRLPDAAADRVYTIWCGPGRCDLVEAALSADGRGTDVRTVDLRGEKALHTANMGRIRIHRRRSKTRLPQQLERLLAAVQAWPPGGVAKFIQGVHE